MPIYEYQCRGCEHTVERMFKMAEKPEDIGECPVCGQHVLRAILSPVPYALVVDHGGLQAKMMREGRLSPDIIDRQRERLQQRSDAFAVSPKGQERRMAQRDRLQKRWGVPLKEEPFTLPSKQTRIQVGSTGKAS